MDFASHIAPRIVAFGAIDLIYIYLYFALYGHLIMARCDEATHRSHFSRCLFVCRMAEKCVHSCRRNTNHNHAHNANRKKAKIGRFSLFYWGASARVFISKFYRCIFTQYAPIYLFYCLRLHRIGQSRPANDR